MMKRKTRNGSSRTPPPTRRYATRRRRTRSQTPTQTDYAHAHRSTTPHNCHSHHRTHETENAVTTHTKTTVTKQSFRWILSILRARTTPNSITPYSNYHTNHTQRVFDRLRKTPTVALFPNRHTPPPEHILIESDLNTPNRNTNKNMYSTVKTKTPRSYPSDEARTPQPTLMKSPPTVVTTTTQSPTESPFNLLAYHDTVSSSHHQYIAKSHVSFDSTLSSTSRDNLALCYKGLSLCTSPPTQRSKKPRTTLLKKNLIHPHPATFSPEPSSTYGAKANSQAKPNPRPLQRSTQPLTLTSYIDKQSSSSKRRPFDVHVSQLGPMKQYHDTKPLLPANDTSHMYYHANSNINIPLVIPSFISYSNRTKLLWSDINMTSHRNGEIDTHELGITGSIAVFEESTLVNEWELASEIIRALLQQDMDRIYSEESHNKSPPWILFTSREKELSIINHMGRYNDERLFQIKIIATDKKQLCLASASAIVKFLPERYIIFIENYVFKSKQRRRKKDKDEFSDMTKSTIHPAIVTKINTDVQGFVQGVVGTFGGSASSLCI